MAVLNFISSPSGSRDGCPTIGKLPGIRDAKRSAEQHSSAAAFGTWHGHAHGPVRRTSDGCGRADDADLEQLRSGAADRRRAGARLQVPVRSNAMVSKA